MRQVVGTPEKEITKVKLLTLGITAEVSTHTRFRDDEGLESVVTETDNPKRKRAVHPDLAEAFLGLHSHYAAIIGTQPDRVEVTGMRLVDYFGDSPKVMIFGKVRLGIDSAIVSTNTHLLDIINSAYAEKKNLDIAIRRAVLEVREYLFGGKIAEPEIWQGRLDFTKDINNGGSGEGSDEEVDPIDQGDEEIEEENPEPLPVPSGGRSKKG